MIKFGNRAKIILLFQSLIVGLFVAVAVLPELEKRFSGWVPGSIISVLFMSQIILLMAWMVLSEKKWISGIGIFLLGSLILFAGVEIIFGKQQSNIIQLDGQAPTIRLDSIYFKNYRPNAQFAFVNHPQDGGDTIRVSINREGIRGPEVKKNTSSQRVLLVGDSFIQALQVAYDETIGSCLNRMYKDSIQFIQHGFSSWSPIPEANWVIQKGLDWQPKDIFLFVYPNDFYEGQYVGDLGYHPFTKYDSNGLPTGFQFPSELTESNWKYQVKNDLKKIGLINRTQFYIRNRRVHKQFPAEYVQDLMQMNADSFEEQSRIHNTSNDPLLFSKWDLISLMRPFNAWDHETTSRVLSSLTFLKKFDRFLQKLGIQLHLVYIPDVNQMAGDHSMIKKTSIFRKVDFGRSGLQTAIQEFCNKENIHFLDLYDGFLPFREKNNQGLYLQYNGHWSATGHQIAAEIVADYLETQRQKK